jgi:hypothetical protein
MTIPNQIRKTCTDCKRSKQTCYFYKSRGLFMAECKECTIERNRKCRQRRLEHYKRVNRESSRKKQARIKSAVFAAYGGFICACCGEMEVLFLTLDHINNDGAAFRKKIAGKQTAAGNTTYRWLYRNGFPEGFQVLCANCQHGKRMNGGICPHQERSRDYPLTGVGPSGPKRTAPQAGDDIVRSVQKCTAVN